MERIDIVNENLRLIQRTEGLNFGTDALLLAAYIDPSRLYKNAMEYGAGTGIVSLLALTRGKVGQVLALEVQEEYARLIKRNADLNELSERLLAIHTDVREYIIAPEECVDLIYTNPPYMKVSGGKGNLEDEKNAARHEVFGDISSFIASAARHLRYGGAFCVVYRTDRLVELIAAMQKYKIEPKRMTFVHANICAKPSMVLIEGRLGGGEGLIVTAPLVLHCDEKNSIASDAYRFILENGCFPPEYYIQNKRK